MRELLEVALAREPLTLRREVGVPQPNALRTGEEVVLTGGPYQGTPGVFLCLRTDANWADITELNGKVRSHPVAWLSRPACVAAETSTVRSQGTETAS